LRQRRQVLQASLLAPEPLRAPVSGVVSAGMSWLTSGRCARTLFEVVNPARLTVEALVYEPTPAQGVRRPAPAWQVPAPN
jgi:hypothetical protein